MTERNLLTTLIVLLLPLSFGLDPGPGRKAPETTGASYISAAHIAPVVTAEKTIGKPATRHSTIRTDVATFAMRPQEESGTFESSFDKSVADDVTCEPSTNTIGDLGVNPVAEDCCCTGYPVGSAGISGVGFSPRESFSGSDSSEDNRTSAGLMTAGGGGRITDAPISTPEPGSLEMLACGIIAIAGIARRRLVRAHADSRIA